jgi:hypothetical protein
MASRKTNKPQEAPESTGFLAIIDAKIAALQKLRASFIDAASLGAMAEAGDVAAGAVSSFSAGLGTAPMDLPTGALLGKSLPAAIKLYLGAVKRKQLPTEIAAALKEGGVESTAANFLNNVTSSLHRLKTAGEVLQFKDGWALAEFYPESLRNRIVKDGKPAKKRSRTSAAKNSKRKAEPKAKAKPHGPQTTAPGFEQRAKDYLLTRQGQYTSVDELAAQLRVPNVQVLRLALGKLAKQGVIEKNQEGSVRFIKKVA